MLKTNQASTVRRYRDRGFALRDIAKLTGLNPADIRDAIREDAAERAELRTAGLSALRRCPVGRCPVEHERIVRANFGDVL